MAASPATVTAVVAGEREFQLVATVAEDSRTQMTAGDSTDESSPGYDVRS